MISLRGQRVSDDGLKGRGARSTFRGSNIVGVSHSVMVACGPGGIADKKMPRMA